MRDAKLNSPNPPNDLLDSFYYLAMYSLYGTFFQGQLSREQAQTIKAQINRIYDERQRLRKLDDRLRQQAIKHHMLTETAARNYAHCKTIENADILWRAIHDLEVDLNGEN